MIENIIRQTEAWLCIELEERIGEDPSLIWEKAENTPVKDIETVKNWYAYLQNKEIIPSYINLEVYSIPRLDKRDIDDMLVIYQEGECWSGFPLKRFTAFTGNWSKKGIYDFLIHSLPSHLVNSEGALDEDEFEDESIEEVTIDQNHFSDTLDDELDDEFFELDESELIVDEEFNNENDDEELQLLISTIYDHLDESIELVDQCSQEAIALAAKDKGSKKLIRLTLNIEENLTELKEKLTIPAENNEGE